MDNEKEADAVLGWHFTGKALRDGRPLPEVGVPLVHDGPVEICASGLHASRRIADALKYAPGTIVSRVVCDRIEHEDDDKIVCRQRTVLWRFDATDVLLADARESARSVLHLWDAPDVVRCFLETGDEALKDAAWAAAWTAARDAAWAAARAAAWAAARAAAWDAARAAAWAAARAAAWDAARDAARAAARDAAWDAARDAARAAARDAAWAAAWDAAWAAAMAAARDAHNDRLTTAVMAEAARRNLTQGEQG